MGSCASKPKYVDYDPQMKHQKKESEEQKKENEEQKKESEEHEVKQEDDGAVSPTRRSGSRPSLGILFQKEKDEQGELLTQQDEKLKIPNPSANVLVSDKLENSGASAIQTVVIEDQVKSTASLAYAKEVPEEPLNHETFPASLDSSSTNKAQDVGTNLAKINDLGLPTATQAPQCVEVSGVDHVEKITGVEGCMTAHDSENQLMTVDTATERGDSSSSLRDDNLDEDAKNSLKPGTELPVVDIEDTSDDVEDRNLGTKISTGQDKIEKSQDSEVKTNVVNDHQTADVEDEVLGATSPANEIYVLNTTIENTCQSEIEASPAVGDYTSNAVKDKTFVAIDRNYVAGDDSGNSLNSETMISNDVNHTSGEVEDKEACDMKLSIENHDVENFLKSGSKSPVVDNLSSFHDVADNKVGATQQGTIDNDCGNDAENSLKLEKEVTPNIDLKHCSNNAQDADLDVTTPINGSGQEPCSRTENTDAVPVEDHHSNSNTLETIEDDHSNSLTVNREEQISESIKASGNELDAIKPIDGFKKEPSRKTENTDLVPVECHHDNYVSTTEEQFLENKKASVAEYVDSVVPTSSHASSVVEESFLSRKEPGERLVTETVETDDNSVSTIEEKFLENKKASVAEYVDSVVPTSSHVSSVVEESLLSEKESGERLVTETVETDDHSASTTEEQFLENKKASVAENVDSVVPTSSHVSSVVEESLLSGKESGERLVTETVETDDNSASTTEEQFLENKKASVAEYVDSVVPTSSHVSSIVEESSLSGKEPGERLVTETVETEGLHRQVEEVAVSSQSDHLLTKAEAEATDVDKNANQDNECSGKTVHSSSQVHQEELTQNEHDKVLNVENVEGASVNNTHHVKDEL